MPDHVAKCVPTSLTAGDTWEFDIGSYVFQPSLYTGTFYLSQGTAAPISSVGVANTDYYRVTVAPTTTATVVAKAQWTWRFRVVEIANPTTHIHDIAGGEIYVLPNPTVAEVATFAETMVSTLETALELLAATTDQSVSFNGQSFSQANIEQYRRDYTFWLARVIAEGNKRNFAMGKGSYGGTRFEFEPSPAAPYFTDPQNPYNPWRS
jgi:hypothetical protein